MKRLVYSLRWDRAIGAWMLLLGRCEMDGDVSKAALLWRARRLCRRVGRTQWSQLRVFGKNGRIQFEHTYPRSSDPRRHKG